MSRVAIGLEMVTQRSGKSQGTLFGMLGCKHKACDSLHDIKFGKSMT